MMKKTLPGTWIGALSVSVFIAMLSLLIASSIQERASQADLVPDSRQVMWV